MESSFEWIAAGLVAVWLLQTVAGLVLFLRLLPERQQPKPDPLRGFDEIDLPAVPGQGWKKGQPITWDGPGRLAVHHTKSHRMER